MRLSANYSIPFFKRLIGKLSGTYERAFLKGIAAQVTAITEAVPVYSGESKASFSEAARLAGVPLFVIPAPRVKSKVAEGKAQGTAKLTQTRKKFSFEIDSNVLQLRINDEFNAALLHPNFQRLKNPGPYNLNTVGNAAFSQAVGQHLKSTKFTIERRTVKNG